MDDSRKLLEQWELELLTPEARSSRERLDALIADDFVEVGSSGLTFGKDVVMEHLPLEQDKTFQASQVTSHMLSATVGLVTYLCLRTQGNTQLLTKRSSIWTKRGDAWQMTYHQATKCEP
jgi:hypothetical protein